VENVAGTALLEMSMVTRPSWPKQKYLFQVLVLLCSSLAKFRWALAGVGKITATDFDRRELGLS
jgi:hypothetical protein